MTRPSQRCPVFEFKPRISYRDDLLLPASSYGIRVPAGLSAGSVPAPTYVSPEQMLALRKSQPQHQAGGGIAITHGLTTADFALCFSNFQAQWRQVSANAAVPFWQFQGGDVYFEVTIGVSVLEGNRPDPNDAESRQIFAILMEHELLHVLDEIDIVSQWMPSRGYQDQMVRRYLGDAQTVDDSMFRHWFRGTRFQDWLRDGLWTPEHNRRKDIRDSAAAYAPFRQRIEALRIQQVNR